MKEILLRAPATIANVGPGFDIFALALESPEDLFRMTLNGEPGKISIQVRGGFGDIPVSPEGNTGGLSTKRVLEKYGNPAGVDIEIIKGMPSSAGLGSSAASAAACAFGLNELLGAKLGTAEILQAASLGEIASGGTPHADNVSGCLLGGFVFIRSPDPPDVVRLPLPEIPVVIRVRRKSQTTTRGMIPERFSLQDLKRQAAQCAEVIRAASAGDVEAFGRAVSLDLVSEPVRSTSIPGYAGLKQEILAAGAFGCNISGGGSSVFALCPPDKTKAIADLMRTRQDSREDEGQVIITRTSNRGIEVVDGL